MGTSGGLLISVPEPKLEPLLKKLSDKKVGATSVVGKIVKPNGKSMINVRV